MTKKVRNYYVGRKETRRRKRIDPESSRRAKGVKNQVILLQGRLLCLITNQRQYFEDQQLCGPLRWEGQKWERKNLKWFTRY